MTDDKNYVLMTMHITFYILHYVFVNDDLRRYCCLIKVSKASFKAAARICRRITSETSDTSLPPKS